MHPGPTDRSPDLDHLLELLRFSVSQSRMLLWRGLEPTPAGIPSISRAVYEAGEPRIGPLAGDAIQIQPTEANRVSSTPAGARSVSHLAAALRQPSRRHDSGDDRIASATVATAARVPGQVARYVKQDREVPSRIDAGSG